VTIVDFESGIDHLAIKKSGFGISADTTTLVTPPGGPLYFVESPVSTENHAQFVFDTTTDPNHHLLYGDPDGTGATPMILLADFGTADLTITDILLK
jgi:hypothetical protein